MEIKDTNIVGQSQAMPVSNKVKLFVKDFGNKVINSKSRVSSKSLAEALCRQAMNHLLNSTFNSTRNVLTKEVLNRAHSLELDGYCDKLKIAFEYQGYPSHWDPGHSKYEETRAKDLLKKQACKELGIILVVIPPFDIRDEQGWSASYVIGYVTSCLKLAFYDNNIRPPKLSSEEFFIDSDIENEDLAFLKQMSDMAKENGGELLDPVWKGYKASYLFKDSAGNEFKRSYRSLKKDGWMKAAASSVTDNIKVLAKLAEFKNLAEFHGCKLISTLESIRDDGKVEFESYDGVRFLRASDSTKSIREKGLPIKYCNPDSPGFKKANEVRQAKRKVNPIAAKNMEFMRTLARANNAELLCTEWVTNSTKYSFKLASGQVVWFACAGLALKGWPEDPTIPVKSRYVNPKIADIRRVEKKEKRLNNLRDSAAQFGYTLLSTEFDTKDSSYLFKDKDGLEVSMHYQHFISKHKNLTRKKERATKTPMLSMAEFICRQAMDHLLQTSFVSTTDVLTAKVLNRSRNLELDGYCDKIRVAFEYQGFPAHWDKKHPGFEHTSALDLIKKQVCKELGIILVVVPPFPDTRVWIPSEVLEHVSKYVKEAYSEARKELPSFPTHEFYINFELEARSFQYLEFMQDIAKKYGCELLDSQWKGSSALYSFRDSQGRKFSYSYKSIKRTGGFLSGIARNLVGTDGAIPEGTPKPRLATPEYVDKMKKLAEANGCTLISPYAVGVKRALEFESASGIRFRTSLGYVKEKGWPAKYSVPGSPGFEESSEIRRVRQLAKQQAKQKTTTQDTACVQ